MGIAKPTPEDGSRKGMREDRVDARHDWWNEVQVAWFTSHGYLPSDPVPMKVSNISSGGMALCSRSMLHIGQMGIVLLGQGRNDALIRGIEVRHCSYFSKIKNHISGCIWAPIPTYLETKVLISDQDGISLDINITKEPSLGDFKDLLGTHE